MFQLPTVKRTSWSFFKFKINVVSITYGKANWTIDNVVKSYKGGKVSITYGKANDNIEELLLQENSKSFNYLR